jgi:hypothetical protein
MARQLLPIRGCRQPGETAIPVDDTDGVVSQSASADCQYQEQNKLVDIHSVTSHRMSK